jgi:UDP-N-acetylglucosamine--N-acetylmuramyl-(pentapeptide) pyrophosphoryl-undecaprenol N-acetylglucosamine transferase
MQQCAKNQKDEIKKIYEENNIKNYVFEFDKDILNLMSSSNLAITRCGATTTAELAQTKTPFIAVPLPNSIDNHQLFNARYYESRFCCWILEQKEILHSQRSFNEKNLYDLIVDIIEKKNRLETKRVQEFMKQISNKNVYQNIENEIKGII